MTRLLVNLLIVPICLGWLRQIGTAQEGFEWDGLSFGIRVDNVSTVVDQLKERNISLPKSKGVLVTGIIPESPAATAGLSEFDLIYKIDGKFIHEMRDFLNFVEKLDANTEYLFEFEKAKFTGRRVAWERKREKIKPQVLKDFALKGIGSLRDEIKGITIYAYQDFLNPPFGASIAMYYSSNPDKVRKARLRFQFRAKDVEPIDEISIRVGEIRATFSNSGTRGAFADNGRYNGTVMSLLDIPVDDLEAKIVDEILKGNTGRVRISFVDGSDFEYDVTYNEAVKMRIIKESYLLRDGVW
jgi:membrane-associated protease RseP (regulator of RpoE activity)